MEVEGCVCAAQRGSMEVEGCVCAAQRGAMEVEGCVRAAQRGSTHRHGSQTHALPAGPASHATRQLAHRLKQLAVCRSQLSRHSLNYRVANCSNYTINHRYVLLPDSFRVQSSQKLSD